MTRFAGWPVAFAGAGLFYAAWFGLAFGINSATWPVLAVALFGVVVAAVALAFGATRLGLAVLALWLMAVAAGALLVGFYSTVAGFWFSVYVGLIWGTGAFAVWAVSAGVALHAARSLRGSTEAS